MQDTLIAPLAMIFYVATVFAGYARLLERQADLWACRFAGRAFAAVAEGTPPAATKEGTARVADMLEKLGMASGAGRRGFDWLHPSIASRVRFLESLAASPAAQARFELRMRLLGLLIVATCLAALFTCAIAV